METALELKRQLGLVTAVLIIIADVIGTGIFVTTGSALAMTGSAKVVLVLWALGGLVAITGALCYAELAAMWPDDGGEYVYLKKIFGPLPSFLTGWISLFVGFTASAAITALTLLWYLNEFFQSGFLAGPLAQKVIAAAVILAFGIMHILGVRRGGSVQNLLTVLKLIIVVSLIGAGLYCADWSQAGRLAAEYSAPGESKSLADYGLVLLIIMFAYSGWNGATYMAGEIKDPQRNLPRAMFWGALLITVIYLLLNVVFLISTPGKDLMGQNAVAAIAASNLFGGGVAAFITLGISVILFSSVSAQMMVGPRVYFAMAQDGILFKSLSRVHPRFQTPDLAIILQTIIAMVYVFIGKDHIMVLLNYMGFALGIFPLLSIIGLVIMRYRQPDAARPFRVPLFPLVPVIYIVMTAGMMTASLMKWTETSLVAVAVVAVGAVVFLVWKRFFRQAA